MRSNSREPRSSYSQRHESQRGRPARPSSTDDAKSSRTPCGAVSIQVSRSVLEVRVAAYGERIAEGRGGDPRAQEGRVPACSGEVRRVTIPFLETLQETAVGARDRRAALA